jgi:hypothetical protein
MELNNVSNSSLVSHFHARLLPKEHEGMSEIALRSPSIWAGVSGHARTSFTRRARACTRCSATCDHLDTNRVAHPTVGELSLNNVIHFLQRLPHTPSITSHSRTSPAISRSELVKVPLGISKVFMLLFMSGGHSHQNTVGVHADSSPKMTPPIPCPKAFIIPTKSGHPNTSSQHQVGSFVDSRGRVWQPSIA